MHHRFMDTKYYEAKDNRCSLDTINQESIFKIYKTILNNTRVPLFFIH